MIDSLIDQRIGSGNDDVQRYSVVAVFGSSSPAVDAAVAGVCGALHVPYISTLTKTEGGSAVAGVGGGGLVARFGPTSRHVSMAVRDLVGDLAWRDVALVVHRQSGNCGDENATPLSLTF